MCSYRNITAVDTMYQCVLTLWLHTTYSFSYYVSIQVLGTQYKVGPFLPCHQLCQLFTLCTVTVHL